MREFFVGHDTWLIKKESYQMSRLRKKLWLFWKFNEDYAQAAVSLFLKIPIKLILHDFNFKLDSLKTVLGLGYCQWPQLIFLALKLTLETHNWQSLSEIGSPGRWELVYWGSVI